MCRTRIIDSICDNLYYIYPSLIIDGNTHHFICKVDILFSGKKLCMQESCTILRPVNWITNTIVTCYIHNDHQGMTANWITFEIWSLGTITCQGRYFFGFKVFTCHMLELFVSSIFEDDIVIWLVIHLGINSYFYEDKTQHQHYFNKDNLI